ncbi:lantibiotic dehydratase [Streptomyces sp. NPDC002164]|uniref:lantibiotic dehydratase n=1 Tax=Streptomyces sp. NPDC002164 TaxID=3364633 RepID=UPI0036AD97D6
MSDEAREDEEMERENSYAAGEPIMCRVSSRSRGDFDFVSPDAPGGPDATDDELIQYIRLLMKDPVLREGIAVSSTSLLETVERITHGFPVKRKKLMSSAVSLTRYMLRMTGRTTPFGLFAGITRASVDVTGSVGPKVPERKSVRLDSEWLHRMTTQWLEDPATRHRVTVTFNNLCFVRGNRLILPYTRSGVGDEASIGASRLSGEFSVRHTEAVSWLRSRTREAVAYSSLLAEAAEKFGESALEKIDSMMAGLIRHELLLTSFAPVHPNETPLRSAMTALGPDSAATPRMAAVSESLEAYAGLAPGDGIESWQSMLELVHSLGDSSRPPLQVDLLSGLAITLPRSVLDEAEAYASAMWSIAPESAPNSHWNEYRNAFLEKYGTGRSVPMERLTDPHAGLGFPATYQNPASHRNLTHQHPDTDTDREEKLASLLQEGLGSGAREIRLSRQDVLDLSGDRPPRVPTAMELSFQVLARDLEALNSGAFELLATPLTGSVTAGATTGRFAGITGSTDELAKLMAAPDPDAITAQVFFMPRTPRFFNLVQVPAIAPHKIHLGTFHDPADPSNIDWRDLCVADDGHRMRLYWQRTGQEVTPVLPHMLNVRDQAPNIARFLAEFRYGGEPKMWQPWDWSGQEHAPQLPRVRFGRTVASPLQWNVDRKLLRAATARTFWRASLENWREKFDIPDRINVATYDRVYGIDLNNTFQQEMLRREIVRNPDTRVTEDRNSSHREFDWIHGRSNEFIVPLLPRRVKNKKHSHFTMPTVLDETTHLPGGEWIFAKLYSSESTQNELLSTFVPALVRDVADSIDRWHFIRYADPDPHLRIRFHGAPEKICQKVLPALFRHARTMKSAGLLRDVQLSSYEPEVSRYGGPEAIVPAEQLFCIDSQSALAQLPAANKEVPSEVLLVANYATLLESLGDWDWCAWAAHVAPRSPGPVSVPRHFVDMATGLIRPGGTAQQLAEVTGVGALKPFWENSTVAQEYGNHVLCARNELRDTDSQNTAILGLLHMQHNRLFGTDAPHERRTLSLLEKASRALRAAP